MGRKYGVKDRVTPGKKNRKKRKKKKKEKKNTTTKLLVQVKGTSKT